MTHLLTLRIEGSPTIIVPTQILPIQEKTVNFSSDLFPWIITILLVGGILSSFAVLMWAGFDWIRSEGDKQALEKARSKIIYAVVGLGVMFMALFIINFFYAWFNIPALSK